MKGAILLLVMAACAFGQAPQPPKPKVFARSSASLKAIPTAASKTVKDDFKTDYGSYDKTFTRTRSINIEVQNFNATVPFTGEVSVQWLGRRGAGGGDRVRLGTAKKEAIQLAPKATKEFNADSGVVKGADMRLRAIGVRETAGFKLEGWIVVLFDANGAPIATKASSPSIEEDYKRGLLDNLPLG